MRTWSFYDPVTGEISSRRITASNPNAVKCNTPEGLIPIEGVYDPLSQRVDLLARQVVDWRPPQPSPDHEWNAARRRWVKRTDVVEREQARANVLARIEVLEASQQRPMRELFIDPNNKQARARIQAIEEQISELRKQLLS